LSAEKRHALVDLDSRVEKGKQLATRQTLRLGEELVVEPSDDLHVLPRHRLLLQAEVGEGAVAVPVADKLHDLALADVPQPR